jgi:OOP family OmpA-OmpF porin
MKTALLITAGILGGFPVASMAASPSIVDENESGFFVGAGLGQTTLRVTSPEFDGSGTAHETGFKLIAGYQFNKFFSLEGAYYQPGKFSESEDGDTLTLDADVVQGFAVGAFPIVNGLDVIGKVGFSRWDSTLTASSGFNTGRLKDNGTDFTWGLGLGAKLTDNLSASVVFEQTKIDAPIIDIPVTWRLRYLYAAVKYRF